jgi:hypothetical protein
LGGGNQEGKPYPCFMAARVYHSVKRALPRFISYLRVSTDGQRRPDLGLEALCQAVAAYIAQTGGVLVVEYHEVENGKRADRPHPPGGPADRQA